MSDPLGTLSTDLGVRSTYDAVSQCSRCGYCEQACPTYVSTGQESKSPRGRNQLIRLMLEGKLKDKASAAEALSTCLLCGACATACYAHVPTADIVLEGRRMLREEAPPLVRFLTTLLVKNPAVLARLLKIANFFKRIGLSRLSRPLLRAIGFKGLAAADEHVHEAPGRFLFEELRQRAQPAKPQWQYFAACGTNYLFPRVGRATIEAVEANKGPGRFLDNACCGLLCYNYGDVKDAKTLALKNIEEAEKHPEGPIVADCSSCSAFLKTYPQLFLDDEANKKRAEAYSARVKDAPEALCMSGPVKAEGVVTYHDSCRARHGQGISAEPRQVMRALFGDAYRELPEADVCCGGAGAFSFINPELSDEVLRRKIGKIASTRATVVAASSTSCLIQLAHGLKNYYPECTVVHISELVAGEKLGAQTRA